MRRRRWAARLAPRCGRSCLAVLAVAGLAAALAGCSGGSKPLASPSTAVAGTPTASAGPTSAPARTQATAEIERTFVTFFAGSTPAATKIGLVQNGQRFAPIIQAQATSELARSTTATVGRVTLTSPTTATVIYTVLLGGKPALPNQPGQAILVNGGWKVAAASFCQLLALEGQKVPGCPGEG